MSFESVGPTPRQRNFIKKLFAQEGSLTSADLVKAAESEDSPIHGLFTWDNRKAANLYRLRQAARILRSYTLWLPAVLKGSKKVAGSRQSQSQPFAVKVKSAIDAPYRWVRTANALEDEFMRTQLALDRVSAVRRFIKQLLAVPELVALHNKLAQVIDSYRFHRVNAVRRAK